MPDLSLLLTSFLALTLGLHAISALLTIWRVARHPRQSAATQPTATVTLLRPVCGLDPNDAETLGSTFRLAPHPALDIVFCVAREHDPAVPLIRQLIAENLSRNARLLIGDERPTGNPKLDNLVKGWRGSQGAWVIMADSNVRLPPNYVADVFAAFGPGTGLVCSPPVGADPDGIAAEIECAFLNTYQARWQLAADTLGFGFAQGKTMLWNRAMLEAAGGIEGLGRDAAEDAAATKIVRAQGFRVRLVDRPYAQPLGRRTLKDVWHRQVRWARLRRATFPLFFLPEIFAGAALPLATAAALAPGFGQHPAFAVLVVAAVWYAIEAALAKAAGWHWSWASPLALLARDLMLPLIWIEGWTGNGFTWRGNDMSALPASTR